MAKLYLKFEQAVLKEVSLSGNVITIGRLPDNAIQVDNLAVSGHHAKIYWDQDHYVVEDNNSLNGTYVNNRRVSKASLKDGDQILVGKHTINFKDEWHEDAPPPAAEVKAMPAMPKMDATVVLDTKRAKEMLAATAKAAAGAPESTGTAVFAASPLKDRMGTLTVMDGKTDEKHYTLGGKLTVIGKSDMASIKLKGWFAPKVAAVINKRDNKYFIAASEKDTKVKVNDQVISGQKELQEGDNIEVAGVKLSFGYQD
jgi:pSer/pThr/pTyr-binding forkhead associated (FHA) protein